MSTVTISGTIVREDIHYDTGMIWDLVWWLGTEGKTWVTQRVPSLRNISGTVYRQSRSSSAGDA